MIIIIIIIIIIISSSTCTHTSNNYVMGRGREGAMSYGERELAKGV